MVKVKKFLRKDYQSDGQLYRNVQAYLSGMQGMIKDHVIEEHYLYEKLVKVVILVNMKRDIGKSDE